MSINNYRTQHIENWKKPTFVMKYNMHHKRKSERNVCAKIYDAQRVGRWSTTPIATLLQLKIPLLCIYDVGIFIHTSTNPFC
jgi:hypothetical protein